MPQDWCEPGQQLTVRQGQSVVPVGTLGGHILPPVGTPLVHGVRTSDIKSVRNTALDIRLQWPQFGQERFVPREPTDYERTSDGGREGH